MTWPYIVPSFTDDCLLEIFIDYKWTPDYVNCKIESSDVYNTNHYN